MNDITINADWSERNPDVTKGFKLDANSPDAITISIDGSYIRLNPTTVWRAAIIAAEYNMKESALDGDGIKAIKRFLEG